MTARELAAYGLGAVLSLPILAVLVAWGFYADGNGLVPGTVALGTVPVLLVVVPLVVLPGPHVRAAAVAGVALLVGDVVFAAYRIGAVDPGGSIAWCVDGACGARPPWLAALIREDESANAGVALTSWLGALYPEEAPQIRRYAPEKYARLDASRGGRPGVNTLLTASAADRVEETVWMPPGDGPVPAIVFLHGYGGSLTAYVAALLESDELARCAIVAPSLGFDGAWWTEDGLAVVRRTVDTLPPRIDRDRLYLVGISNGAIGASAVAADAGLAPRFRAIVALEGVGDAELHGPPRTPMLVIAGEDDQRFPVGYVEDQVAAYRGEGGDIELVRVPGDHMAFFAGTVAIDDAIAAFVSRSTRPP